MIVNALSRCLWAVPGRFAIVRALGPDIGLRVVLFHDVSAKLSDFTDGLDLTMNPSDFESRIAFLARCYSPVSLQQVIDSRSGGNRLPKRPLLVTFDDAYASVARVAAPILKRYRVPAVFFVNSGFVDGASLGLDNIICFAINTEGLQTVRQAAVSVDSEPVSFENCAQAIQGFTSRLDQSAVQRFRSELLSRLKRDPLEEARACGLHVTSAELRTLAGYGIEIGNHTAEHVWCRNLDESGRSDQLIRGQAELENITGRKVRSFSVPYGESRDLTPEVHKELTGNGHEALFLVEGLANDANRALDRLDRVSLEGVANHSTFAELEILPRLRRIRNYLRPNRI